MALKPGPLTDWPWQRLGSYKYLVLAPFVLHAVSTVKTKELTGATLCIPFYLLIFRLIHDQIWMSLSRFQNARSKHRIQSRSMDFQQVDRERNWDDQAIMHCMIFYIAVRWLPGAGNVPVWNTKGLVLIILLHAGPVELIYYWGHRALHHHFLYTRYHSHHHSSYITEPITSVVHPFAEHLFYASLFAMAMVCCLATGTVSMGVLVGYVTFIDFMNNWGHCNFELVPLWAFNIFPPLKYLIYTPSYHSLHHSHVHTNFCLFMPIYDLMYRTIDQDSDSLYKASMKGREELTHVVHLSHLTTLDSIYHLRLGFPSLASEPHAARWYMWAMWPVTAVLTVLMWIFGSTFTVEQHRLDKLKMQTWIIPKYSFQYSLPSEKKSINILIEKAILEAEASGVKVISLGLLNQSEELNKNGELYVHNQKKMKIRVVDGSTLSAAVVLNSIPRDTPQVFIGGKLNRTGYAVALALCQRRKKVLTDSPQEFAKLKQRIPIQFQINLIFTHGNDCKVWLLGDKATEEEHKKAGKGTIFIPCTQFPPRIIRRDCHYHSTPAMVVPDSLENVYSCENWLPRRVMSASRVGGIVHALEGWDLQECGDTALDMEKVWLAALRHGFRPFSGVNSGHFA